MVSNPKLYSPKQMLEKLIGFDTTSRNSNLSLVEFVQSYLQEFGIDSHLVYNEQGDKANLFATICAGDGQNKDDGGIVLSGHSDVVPVDGQDWATDPFTLTQIDNKLYGRGTCDMKGFSACVLSLVRLSIKYSCRCFSSSITQLIATVFCVSALPMWLLTPRMPGRLLII